MSSGREPRCTWLHPRLERFGAHQGSYIASGALSPIQLGVVFWCCQKAAARTFFVFSSVVSLMTEASSPICPYVCEHIVCFSNVRVCVAVMSNRPQQFRTSTTHIHGRTGYISSSRAVKNHESFVLFPTNLFFQSSLCGARRLRTLTDRNPANTSTVLLSIRWEHPDQHAVCTWAPSLVPNGLAIRPYILSPFYVNHRASTTSRPFYWSCGLSLFKAYGWERHAGWP